jgi:prepilin-type N-terminal cleavage/methylation domain-containing protein
MARPFSAGFTLVEILVVVVIMGIAGAIILPQLSARDDMKAAAAARVVMGDLIYAQNLAITTQSYKYLQFDVVNKNYSVVDDALTVLSRPTDGDTYTQYFGSISGSSKKLEATLLSANLVGISGNAMVIVGFDELGAPIVYPGSGSPESMITGAITVQSGGYRIRVDIEPYTGQISVTKIP